MSNTAGTLPVTISGFTLTSDAIDLTAIGTDGTIAAIDNVNHRVTVSGSGGSVTLQLDASDATNFATVLRWRPAPIWSSASAAAR